jgi:hypothetical protein
LERERGAARRDREAEARDRAAEARDRDPEALRAVVLLAGARRVARLAGARRVARLAVERAALRLAGARRVVRLAVERALAAVERVVRRLAVERPAGLRRVPVRLEALVPGEPATRFCSRSTLRSRALTSRPTSLRNDATVPWAVSSALLRRLMVADSLAADRFRVVFLVVARRLAVARRRDAGFFAGGMSTLLESS